MLTPPPSSTASVPAARPPRRSTTIARRRSRLARAGFTLIEVIAATLLFGYMSALALWVTSDAYDLSMAAEDARALRFLAERKLGEVAVFERHFDVNDSSDFQDLPEEIRDRFRDWKWETEIRDVTVFGTQTDPNADYLFESPEEATTTTGTAADAGGEAPKGAAKKGDTQMLREIVLRVKTPGDEGEGELVEIVTYLPQVPQKTAAGKSTTGSGE